MCHVACRFRELQNTNLPKTGLDNDLTETEMYWNVAMLPETWSIERIATQSIAFLSNRGRLDSILGISFFNFRRKKNNVVASLELVSLLLHCAALCLSHLVCNRWKFFSGKLLCKTWVKGKHKHHCWHSLRVQRDQIDWEFCHINDVKLLQHPIFSVVFLELWKSNGCTVRQRCLSAS